MSTGKPDSCENDICSVTFVDLKCDTRKRKFRHLAGSNSQTLMSAEFEMNVKPATPTGKSEVSKNVNAAYEHKLVIKPLLARYFVGGVEQGFLVIKWSYPSFHVVKNRRAVQGC